MDALEDVSVWQPTPELRWAAEEPEHPLILQQLWLDGFGNREWRTIPNIFTPGYDPEQAPVAIP